MPTYVCLYYLNSTQINTTQGAPHYRNTQVRKCTSGCELLNQTLRKPPLTNPPQARKPTRPVSGSVPPPSTAAWPHLHPQSKKKKEKTSTFPSSSTISHICFSFLAPKTKTTWGREEVGGVRDGAELYGRPFHIIDISSMWWDTLWLKLRCLPKHINIWLKCDSAEHLETMLFVSIKLHWIVSKYTVECKWAFQH